MRDCALFGWLSTFLAIVVGAPSSSHDIAQSFRRVSLRILALGRGLGPEAEEQALLRTKRARGLYRYTGAFGRVLDYTLACGLLTTHITRKLVRHEPPHHRASLVPSGVSVAS